MIKKLSYVLILISLLAPTLSESAYAVTASDWNAGNIIDDAVFTNANSMSVSQIQTFLNKMVGTGAYGAVAGQCDTNGTHASEWGGGTRAQYGAAHGNPAPFTCLKDYYEVPKTTPSSTIPASNYGGKPKPTGSKSAAQLIYDAAQAYNISPKVLLVKLGTESQGPLTSDDWPFKSQYTYAMGAHCPDSGPNGSANCDVNYSGFSMQIREAAKLLRSYIDNMSQPWWGCTDSQGNKIQCPQNQKGGSDPGGGSKVPYATNYILWNVSSTGCGGANIAIQNRATAALYTYTPYQPNQASLDNMPGTGNGCSSYGNRNFWLIFNNWFGSTHVNFTDMDKPRWMQTKADTYKRNPGTNDTVDGVIPAGTQIYFSKRVVINGNLYLQTQHDTDAELNKGILYSDLQEISMDYQDLLQPRWMQTTKDLYKVDPQTGKNTGAVIPSGTQVFMPTKIIVGGKQYLRTQHDTNANIQSGIPEELLVDANLEYLPLVQPRWMQTDTSTYMYDIRSLESTGTSLPTEAQLYGAYKVLVNGEWYVYDKLPDSNEYLGVPLSLLSDLEPKFVSMQQPRWLITNTDTYKKVAPALNSTGYLLPKDTAIQFTSKVLIGDQWYLRTKYDTSSNQAAFISLADLQEVPSGFKPLNYEALLRPRQLKAQGDIQNLNLVTMSPLDPVIPDGTAVMFTTKVLINGKWYLRTQDDSRKGYSTGIPLQNLVEIN